MAKGREKTDLDRFLRQMKQTGWIPSQGWERVEAEFLPMILNKGFRSKSLPLALAAYCVIEERRPVTVRGGMYGVVSAGFLPDTGPKSYCRAQRVIAALRLKGVIDWSWVVDNVRARIKDSSWSGLVHFAESVKRAYRRNYWADLPDFPLVICEKDAIAGTIAPVTRQYDVPLYPLRGFTSLTFAHEIAEDMRRMRKPVFVYYVGDFDPSGMDIERNVRESLERVSGCRITWKRLGVLAEHFKQYHLIPLTPKKKDSRFQRFIAEHGTKCAEIDALPAPELRQMVQDAIESHIPQDQWKRLQHIEQQERESFAKMFAQFGGRAQ